MLTENNCDGGLLVTWIPPWSQAPAAAPPEQQALMDQVHFKSSRLPYRLRACFALSLLSAAQMHVFTSTDIGPCLVINSVPGEHMLLVNHSHYLWGEIQRTFPHFLFRHTHTHTLIAKLFAMWSATLEILGSFWENNVVSCIWPLQFVSKDGGGLTAQRSAWPFTSTTFSWANLPIIIPSCILPLCPESSNATLWS